jgi:hypothetical protein
VDWQEIEKNVSRTKSSAEHLILDVSLLQWSPPIACDSSEAESDNELSVESNEVS